VTKVLAYFPSPPQGVWHLGPLPIRAYALFIITGIVVALVIGDRRWEARGGQRGVIYDIALWAVPFGLVGGRLYHLATDWRTYWGPGGAGSGAALRIWDGGLGIWGAVALGGVGAWIGCRRRGIPLPAFADAIAPGIVLAQAIGRLGNYFNQELYGRETTLPWGLEIFYRRDPSGYVDPHSLDGVSTGQVAFVVQPTFLYELIWNVLIFVALIYVDRRFNFGHGRLFALYVAAYCVGRFGVELLRNDTATQIAGIRINVFTSTFVFIGAVVYVILAPKGREDPASLHGTDYGAEEAPESKAEAEPQPEPITGASVAAAAGVAAVLAAGKTAKRLIPRMRSGPVESAGAEASEAETVKAKAAEAEVAEPTADEPETVEAEVAEAEVAEAEVAEPETAKVAEPEVAEPETAEVVAETPETVEAQAEAPETDEAEAAEAEAEESDEPEVADAEAAVAEAVESESAEPEAAEAEAVATEVAEAEAAEPEAEELQPEPEVADAEAAAAEAESESPEPEVAEESAPDGDEDDHAEAEPEAKPDADTDEAAEATSADDAGSTRRRLSFRLRNRRGQ
jgi:prolipoprotein diacylglyceryl transferase